MVWDLNSFIIFLGQVLAIIIFHSGNYVLNSNVERNHPQVVKECHILLKKIKCLRKVFGTLPESIKILSLLSEWSNNNTHYSSFI